MKVETAAKVSGIYQGSNEQPPGHVEQGSQTDQKQTGSVNIMISGESFQNTNVGSSSIDVGHHQDIEIQDICLNMCQGSTLEKGDIFLSSMAAIEVSDTQKGDKPSTPHQKICLIMYCFRNIM